jgi:S-adenosylmethionine:tRNA ribosyltransferase-isomerase
MQKVLVSDFNYSLPDELIAQEPLAERAASRMLRLDRQTGKIEHRHFRDFPSLLQPGDLVVFNNTRVFPARLFGRRSGLKARPLSDQNPAARDFLKGEVEVLLTRQICQEPNEWECLVRPGRKIGIGERLFFGGGSQVPKDSPDGLVAEVIARGTFGERRVRFSPVPDFFQRVERTGHVPLPPYVTREDRASDRDRYQTVYARERGSVAAPTLEFSARQSGRVKAARGEADLFIYPGFQFRVVGAMLTNFHLPQSTLLMLVCAFGGTEQVLASYRHAVEHKYRFYSYGDCMFVG